MPKVSVILTHYNHRAYLLDAVQSIINQTYEDWELLIMNDDPVADLFLLCQLDSRADMADLFPPHQVESRIHVYQTIFNVGQTVQLNRGLNLAKGEFIAFQDADDISIPQRLELSVKAMEDADLVFGNKVFLCPSRQIYWESPPWTPKLLHKRPTGAWGSYMVRKNKMVRFDESVTYWNDHIWEAEMSNVRVKKIDLPLYYQRTYSSQYRTCKIPIYRKFRRLYAQRKINKRVKSITGA